MCRCAFGQVSLVVWMVFSLAGCGQSTGSVEGEVTYDGQPVENGTITFLPADGKGPQVGGKILNGRYTVADVPPGPKVVQVDAVKAVTFARTSDEMARRATASIGRGNRAGIIDPADIIPANAEGNHAAVAIKPGKQALNFHLKKPSETHG